MKDKLLTDKEINQTLGYPPRPAPQASHIEIASAIFVAKAQDTKTVSIIKEQVMEAIDGIENKYENLATIQLIGEEQALMYSNVYNQAIQAVKDKISEVIG